MLSLSPQIQPVFKNHARRWKNFRYVYPVISRRSNGVSIGINLQPSGICNFNCVYCQIDRNELLTDCGVDLPTLESELNEMCRVWSSGEVFEEEPFASAPLELRRLNDIAFSGNAEPTTFGLFEEVVDLVARVKQKQLDESVRLILITNASGLDRASVRRGLRILDAHEGEIWAKLDAGTESYFRAINRTHVSFKHILANIESAGKVRPICIQTLFLKFKGIPPSGAEVEAYSRRLVSLLQSGVHLKHIQIYTVARPTALPEATALGQVELEQICEQVRAATRLAVTTYPGCH